MVGDLSIEGIQGTALVGGIYCEPAFTGSVTIGLPGAPVADVGVGDPDFWANLINASPVIEGSGFVQRVSSRALTISTTWGAHPAFSNIELGQLTIRGYQNPVLTISPGSLVTMRTGGIIRVGDETGIPGGLKAVGDITNPITFDLEVKPSAFWLGVEFNSGSIDAQSILDYCVIKNGGTSNAALIECNSAAPSITNVTLDSSATEAMKVQGLEGETLALAGLTVINCLAGISIDASSGGNVVIAESVFFGIVDEAIKDDGNSLTLVTECSFDNVGVGVKLSAGCATSIFDCDYNSWVNSGIDAAVGSYPAITLCNFDDGGFAVKLPASAINIFSNYSLENHIAAAAPAIVGVYGETIGFSSRWASVDNTPYHILGPVQHSAQLRIDAGATLMFDAGAELKAIAPPSSTIPAALIVSGKSINPVTFTSSTAPSNWKGIECGPGSSIEYAVIEYAGSGSNASALALVGASIVRDSTIQFSAGSGVLQVPLPPDSPGVIPDMAEPTSLLSSQLVSNADSGVDCRAQTWTNIVGVTCTGNGDYALIADAAVLGVRESNLNGNTLGGVLGTNSTIDASFNWWGDASGPSGAGSGSGASISSNVDFNPWYGTELLGFRIDNPAVNLLAFAPLAVSTRFFGEPSQAADWEVHVLDSTTTEVFQDSGSGDFDVVWDGGNGGTPPSALPDGSYQFSITATESAAPNDVAIINGLLTLDSNLLIAEIDSPSDLQIVRAGSNIIVRGTAAGANFAGYTLEYGLGSEPAEYVTVSNSNQMVVADILGFFFIVQANSPYLTIRLTVTDSSVPAVSTVHSRVVKFLSLWNPVSGPDPFSPNGDEFEDLYSIQSGITWASNWSLAVRKLLPPPMGQPVDPIWTASGTGTQIFKNWNGLRNSGERAGNGNYVLGISAAAIGTTPTVGTAIYFSIDQSGDAIRIASPIDGAVLNNSTPVVLETDFDDEMGYSVRLEYGSAPYGQVISQQTSIPNPFATWETSNIPNGSVSLNAFMISADGTVHADSIAVELGNLLVNTTNPVFDPLSGVQALIDIDSGRPTADPADTVTVSIYKASTSEGTEDEEATYSGPSSQTVLWTDTKSLASGLAIIPWNGQDSQGLTLPSGEYAVFATATYQTSPTTTVTADFAPMIELGTIQNGTLSAMGVDLNGMGFFDPYYGDLAEIQFTVSETEWVTAHYAPSLPGYAIVANQMFESGSPHTIYWDGRSQGAQGFKFESSAGGSSLESIFLRACRAPVGLISLVNESVKLSSVEVSPVAIFPSLGQVANIAYQLTGDSNVLINVYEVVPTPDGGAGEVGALYRSILNTFQAAGAYSVEFDGSDSGGLFPKTSGTYSVEIVAENPTGSSYRDVRKHFIRVLY